MKKLAAAALLSAVLLCSCTGGDAVIAAQGGVGRTVSERETESGGIMTEETTAHTETEAATQTDDASGTESAPDAPPDGNVFAPLDALLSNPPVPDANVAFYYEDMAGTRSYSFNGDVPTYSASLIKLPYALALLYAAEGRDMGFDEIFTFTGTEDTFGSGEIKNAPIGSTYTFLELIEYSLRVSDNVAFGQLREKHGMRIYFDFARSIGADSLCEWDGWVLTARDGAKVLRSAYNYIEGNHRYSAEIKDAMVRSTHTVMLCPGLSGKEVARKYGWDDRAYHDMGIVYDDQPYILVFLSDMVSGSAEVNGYISSVARTADLIHGQLCGDGGE